LNKRALLLSAAAAALLSSPALALDTITTVQTTVVKTSTAGTGSTPDNVQINAGGGINVKGATPLITIDSSNTVVNAGTLSDTATSGAVGVVIDATSGGLTGSFSQTGNLDLSGTGTGKTGFHLSGPTSGTGSFTGSIDIGSGSTGAVNIVGDGSTGILFDSNSILNGDLVLGGTFAVTPTTANETSSSAITLANLAGTINGNVVVDPGAKLSAVGNNAQGIIISGPIKACATLGCTEIGSFINNGQIVVAGVATRSTTKTNANSGSALVIENGIAGGILNNGPASSGDSTAAAVISANGISDSAPTILIRPLASLSGTNMVIGIDTADTHNGTYSFINRGTIAAAGENANNNAHTIVIAGLNSSTNVVFSGDGLLNSGAITAQAAGATKGAVSGGVNAVALDIRDFVTIPKIVVSSQAAATGAQGGIIAAAISGSVGGTARGIIITGTAASVPEIDLDAGASISATATLTDQTVPLTHMFAIAIEDDSGSLNLINNRGAIAASAYVMVNGTPVLANSNTLTNGGTAQTTAINVAANTTGVIIHDLDNGRIIGDVLFGSGSDWLDVVGTSPPVGQTATAFVSGTINFGTSTSGPGDRLHVGQFANVAGTIKASGDLDITVDHYGTLSIQNIVTTASDALDHARNLTVSNGGTLDLTVSEGNTSYALVKASGAVTLNAGSNLNIAFGSLLSGGSGNFKLIEMSTANDLIDTSVINTYNSVMSIAANRPYLLDSAQLSIDSSSPGLHILQLAVAVKTAATLGLTGYAKQMFPLANAAIANDPTLGAALIAGVSDQATAQAAYDAFAPDATGGSRAIAIALTDQTSGAVSARLRNLRLFAKEPGELTLWGTEFGQYLSTHGGKVPITVGSTTTLDQVDGFKDHGFGFSVGLDAGTPAGWYGAAFSFYTGDIASLGDRNTKDNSLWYMLTGYSTWRGKALFVDTQVNVGYASLKGKRILSLQIPIGSGNYSTFTREADNKHAGEFASLGMTMGAMLKYGGVTTIPQISIDGLTMREEGYTETNGGYGMNLTVNPYYANSLRAFLGTEFRTNLNLGDFFLQPAARLGYRFDFLNDPAKLRAAFADMNSITPGSQPGTVFTVQGPDPSRGNLVLGAALNATTENWTIGLNYDFVRGAHNATEQVGTIALLGRI
jgi:hypothetical protein